MKRKVLSVVLTLAMLVTMIPAFTLVSNADTENWYTSGTGNESDPYIISDTAGLEGLAAAVNGGANMGGKYIKLSDDFDGEEALTTPIGIDDNHPFAGNFDGNGKTVSLDISRTVNVKKVYAGIIGYLTGSVKDLITAGNVYGKSNKKACVGGVIGYSLGSIKNCVSLVSTVSGVGTDDAYVGGLVGSNRGPILNSSASGNIEAEGGTESNRAGGIAGYSNSDIINCYSTGSVTAGGEGDVNSTNYSGGIVGHYSEGESVIVNCYSTSIVSSKSGSKNFVGGIAGKATNVTIKNCYYLQTENINASLDAISKYNQTTIITNAFALSRRQMKASSGKTNDSWKAIPEGETTAKMPLVDALNAYVEANSEQGLKKWTISSYKNYGYPTFYIEPKKPGLLEIIAAGAATVFVAKLLKPVIAAQLIAPFTSMYSKWTIASQLTKYYTKWKSYNRGFFGINWLGRII